MRVDRKKGNEKGALAPFSTEMELFFEVGTVFTSPWIKGRSALLLQQHRLRQP